MSYKVAIKKRLIQEINKLPPKTRRIISEAFVKLEENLFPGNQGDKEWLELEEGVIVYRLHIGRSYTAFYTIQNEEHTILIHELMTIEQAHKRYGRL